MTWGFGLQMQSGRDPRVASLGHSGSPKGHCVLLRDMPDSLSERYEDLLSGSYDCVDRIVLNAYFRMGHDPGGFRL